MALLHLTCGFGCPPTDFTSCQPLSYTAARVVLLNYRSDCIGPLLKTRVVAAEENPNFSAQRSTSYLPFHLTPHKVLSPIRGKYWQRPVSRCQEMWVKAAWVGGLIPFLSLSSPQAPPPVKREKARAGPSRCWGRWGLRNYASRTNKCSPKELALRPNRKTGKPQTNFHWHALGYWNIILKPNSSACQAGQSSLPSSHTLWNPWCENYPRFSQWANARDVQQGD